jgi:hypothetical protein
LNRKEICRLRYDTHKIKWTNRVKGKNLILNLLAGLDGSPGSKTVQEKLATIQNTSEKTNVFKIECCGSSCPLPTKRMKQKVCRFLSDRKQKQLYEVVANEMYTVKLKQKMSLTKAKERATSTCRCQHVRVSVQRYSVQYKGYNLIGVTTVEGGTTRGMTTLVY